jgi:ribosomal protein S18 acetylase RimI-like enzyme
VSRTSSGSAFAGVGGFVVLSILVLPFLGCVIASAAPRAGDRFEYDYNTNVDQGAGDYFGYTDHMRSHSAYAIQDVQGDAVTVRGTGSWVFDGSDGTHQSGIVDVLPVFSLSSRRYLSGIDVDVKDPPNATVWFWIPTPVVVGQTIPLIDDVFTVTSLHATLWFGLVPHEAVQLDAAGTYVRDDAYGRFDATYRDRYYFDRESGFIVGEQFEETDTDAFNPFTSFHFHGQVILTSSSYAVPLDLVVFSLVDLGIPATAVGSVAAAIRVRRGPSRVRIGSKDFPIEVRIRKAKSPADVANLQGDGSPFFGPFLPVFAERSFSEGDPVVLALAGNTIQGMALMDQESGLGSLFAADNAVVRVLLKRLRMRDFFADGSIPGRLLDAQEIDRFTILQLRNPSAVAYDSSIVRPMTADDVPAVGAIAESVYRSPARRFIVSSFQAGDLGFVAVAGSRVVGFGFATVVGSVGRLHTLTVLPTERARGLGKEITNARLSTLAALGVERVILEISKQNVASMRIATHAGFSPIGESIYYSRAPGEAPTALQRRT